MIRLISTSSAEKRVKHTLKHFYNLAERFYELTGDLASWHERWNALRTADALDPNRPERVYTTKAAEEAARTGHEDWFAQAEKAVAYAEPTQQSFLVDPTGRYVFVGHAGVLVFTQQHGQQHALRTCFRCTPSWRRRQRAESGSLRPWEEAAWYRAEKSTDRVVVRTAVRRAQRRALPDRSEAPAVALPTHSQKEPAP